MMKRFLAIVACLLIWVGVTSAGEIRTLPTPINLTDNTTDQYEAQTLTFYYGASPYAEIVYNVIDSKGRVYRKHTEQIRNIADDPDTPEDETSTAFSDFIAGFGSTIYNRSGALMESRIYTDYPND